MFSRISQVTRHLSAPVVGNTRRFALGRTMTPISADERNSRTISTAACLIIGDEVLGGKTVDTNSAYFAKWCFNLGINLKRIEVIEDDEGEIVEAVQRMSDRYDFVVTSGGIGPTHDDITYQSIAKAFNLPLKLHQETFDKMKLMSKVHPNQPKFDWDVDSPARRAKLRMAELPIDESRDLKKQAVFPHDDLWVPVSVVNGNIHILPGIPRLFQRLLDGLKPHILPRLSDPEGKGTHRVLFSTPLPESGVADYLTTLAAKVGPKGVKVGSYPRWGKKNNTVTLVGRDLDYLESLVDEVQAGIQGLRVDAESDGEEDPKQIKKQATEDADKDTAEQVVEKP
ncbi:3'-phosphoadenosine 5'-phosphosulfate sulfotransferase (PAPS reductase) FAD synthetase s [Fusarium pseudocircinatum]|uniref:3'-phosphoadenosine 5'-phosphosulfate sulfotransferase (PAPS reductase) FAD synthetase s n=1 Tax=Fusarium pseudocircinatum TaxID=56676 RepID=A0A8H5V0M7_9HYPO|nr:3'-phosphoadenosine 5'-phosphosulfate sulfotransferase (PAPS reductase) FAD synthetase s [Fusarium pseudocircinatum]